MRVKVFLALFCLLVSYVLYMYVYIYIRYTSKKTFHTVALNRGNVVRPFKKPVERQ